MKSIKPGRGPSGLGVIGAVCAMVFGVFWTIMAFSITRDAPGLFGVVFPLFGIVFIVMAGVQGIYHYKNATGRNRFSMMDITDSREEGDPSEDWVRESSDGAANVFHQRAGSEAGFCPYCGAAAEPAYNFCRRCGKQI